MKHLFELTNLSLLISYQLSIYLKELETWIVDSQAITFYKKPDKDKIRSAIKQLRSTLG